MGRLAQKISKLHGAQRGTGFEPVTWPVRKVRATRGFTLLEVIVAMLVLAIGIAGVLAALSACLRNTEIAENYSRGAIFAQQVAGALERSTPLQAGTQSGSFSDASTGPDDSVDTAIGNPVGGFAWTADVSPADSTGCYPTQITVTWNAAQPQYQQQYQLNTVLFPQPIPSSPPPSVPGTIAPAGRGTSSSTSGASSTTGASTPGTTASSTTGGARP